MTLAELDIVIDADQDGAIAGLNDIDRTAADVSNSATGRFRGFLSNVGHAAVGAAKAAAVGIAVVGGLAINAAAEAEQVAAQTTAVIESTGQAAGVTAGHVADLAGSIRDYSGISDEAVQSGENMLLTFTNIRNGVGENNQIFDEATRVLADMSTALGTDMATQAVSLGKALNDPIKGITALQRVGVTFTDQQREMIASMVEAGDVAGAQGIILDELAKEFGGSAEAMGSTVTGQFNIMKEQVGDALETVGGSILGVVSGALPALSGAFTTLVDTLAPVLEQLFEAIAPVLTQLVDALAPVLGDIGQSFADIVVALLPLIPPLGELVAAVAPLIPLLVDLLVTALEPLIPVLVTIIETIAAVVDAIVTWVEESEILRVIGEIIAEVVTFVIEIVTGFIGFLADAWGSIRDTAVTVWNAISGAISGPIRAVKGTLGEIWDAIKGAAVAAWNWVKDHIGPIIDGIIAFIERLIGAIQTAIEWLQRLGSGVGGALGSELADAVENGDVSIPGLALGGLVTGAGLALVGERGAEVVSLPRGAEVHPAGSVPPSVALQSGPTIQIYAGNIVTERGLEELIRTTIIRINRREGNDWLEEGAA